MERFTRRRSHDGERDLVGYAVAGLAPVAVAALLVRVRGEIDHTNLALVLVVVVVLVAIVGGRGPGAVAAVLTTVSYDFFLTRPYTSFSIDSADDIETTIILLVIGILVGQLVVGARRHRRLASRGADEIARVHRVSELAASGAPVEELEQAVATELAELLGLRACRYEATPSGPALSRLERNGAISGATSRRFAGEEFALPEAGVELPVLGRGRERGRFVLTPDPAEGASLEERVVAVALSDQFGAVLAAEPRPAEASPG
jgi:K+-sensing histidine kinase KdpD